MSILDKQYKYVHVDLVTETYSDVELNFSASDENTSDFYVIVTRLGKKIDLSGKTITLYVYKPDGTHTDMKVSYIENLNSVYCDLPLTFKDVAGNYKAQLYIEDAITTEKIMSSMFVYKVKNDLLYDLKHPQPDKDNGTGGTSKPVVTPLTITFNSTPTVIEANVATPITLNWGYSDKISSQTMNGNQIAKDVRKVTETISGTTTYTLSAIKEGATTQVSKSIRVDSVYPFYYGTFGDSITSSGVKLGNKLVEAKGTKTVTLSYTDSRVFFAYPKTYGVLDTIKDRNGFEYITDFNREEVTIDNVAYYIYKIKNKASVSEIRYTFGF